MNGHAMYPSDFSLFRILSAQPNSQVVYFSESSDDSYCNQIPNKLVVINPSEWQNPSYWNSLPEHIKAARPRIAVFNLLRSEIPPEAFKALNTIGTSTVVSRDSEGWTKTALNTFLGLGILPGFRQFESVLNRTFNRLETLSRKIVIKYFGVDLIKAGAEGYVPEGGNCYRATVAHLRPYADYHNISRNEVYLFEEIDRLQPHQPHTEIRDLGLGRMSHWENDFFFSSSDNTDPNTNGRRYRYLHASGWKRVFAPLFRLSSPFTIPRYVNTSRNIAINSSEYSPTRFERYFEEQAGKDSPRGFQLLGLPQSDDIALLISSLAPGGAERQLCYLACKLKRQGKAVRVLTWEQKNPENLHYLPFLQEAGVEVNFISSPHPEFPMKVLMEKGQLATLDIFKDISPYFSSDVWSLYTHLMVLRPKVLHCWLDHPNLVGGMAGWLSGVSNIILSTRNVNPTHFAYIYQTWYHTWYSLLTKSSRIRFIANSHVGAESYASWLKIPSNEFTVVHNGLDLEVMKYPSDESCRSFRASLGIPLDAPLIAGVFRLNYEKRPSLFLRTIGELRKEFPSLRAVIAGVGPLDKEVAEEIKRRGLENVVHLLGRSTIVPTIMRASDIILLTSSEEGLPNVLMEAQWFGRPIVATNVGGTAEVVKDGQSGFIVDQGDTAKLIDQCRTLLIDPNLRKAFGETGQDFIQSSFSLEKMTEQTANLYYC